jgi:hypothetical protein
VTSSDDNRSGEREPRVRDLLEDEDLDPATIAQLAAWFGGPAPADTEPEPDPDPESSIEDRQREQLLAARKRATDAVQPEMMRALEDRGHRYSQVVEPLRPLEIGPRERLGGFDLARWPLRNAGEPQERERPEEIAAALEERVPQAILRDLHRPIRSYGAVALLPVDLGLDVAGERARAEVRDLMTTRYKADPTVYPSASSQMYAAIDELRAVMGQPWAELSGVTHERRGSLYPSAEDMRWFGSVGVDPDL